MTSAALEQVYAKPDDPYYTALEEKTFTYEYLLILNDLAFVW